MFKKISGPVATLSGISRDLKQCAYVCVTCLGVAGFVWCAAFTFDASVPSSLCTTHTTVFTTFSADIHC